VKDAHKVKSTKVRYSYHPLHGETVQIIQTVGENYIIKTKDGTKIGIPKWMTERAICNRIKHSSIPYCSHIALKELRSLVDRIKDKK